MKRLTFILLLFPLLSLAQSKKMDFAVRVQPSVFSLTKVMMHDVVNPPAASRYYAYCLLGAYDIVSNGNAAIVPPSVLISNYRGYDFSAVKNDYDYYIAAVYCILESGRLLLPSGFMLEEEQEKFLRTLRKNKFSEKVILSSVALASEVAKHVVNFSKNDNYNKLSAQLRYTPVKGDAYWYPTPPAYMEAVEPHWKIVRTLIIDSCNQFVPQPPVPFSTDSNSAFFRMVKEVYDVTNRNTKEHELIASFWDCNPFVVATSGHMMLGYKKISPGGHWMNIAGICAKKANLNFDQTIVVHALVAATLMDAFISCWDEKYRSNRIRPETFINRYIDKEWQPLLQTPPFPEYTSGHSVISAASADVLTYLLGDHFSFTDDTETMFDIPERKFNSFRQAAAEAAISRLYGGIHYRDAIENGQAQGEKIAEKIISKMKEAGILTLQLQK